jgi:enoyl-CoA hydratase/carnithine racemase
MSDIATTIQDGVLSIVFNRPHKKNALTEEMYAELVRTMDRGENDAAVKVILFSGAGGAFTAGNDLDDFVQRPPRDLDAPVFQFLIRLVRSRKPLIAAVEGVAVGIGTTLLFHCDLVYIGESAKFAVPFVSLGLCPEGGSSLLFPRVAGHQRAAEKLWLGEPFDAQEALQLGFVNQVLPTGQALAHALQKAQRLAALPQGSVRVTKALLRGQALSGGQGNADDTLLAQMRAEAAMFVERLNGPAAKEAIAAFLEKRKPNFSGIE